MPCLPEPLQVPHPAKPGFFCHNVVQGSNTMSFTSVTDRPRRSRIRRLAGRLWFQVVVAAVLGVAVGLVFPAVGSTLTPLNDWFIALVKMIVIPVVFCVVVTGIASMDNLRKAGRIGAKAIGYFLVLS